MKLPKPQPGTVVCLAKVGKIWVIGGNDRTKTSPAFIKRMADGDTTYTRHAEAHAIQLAKRSGARLKQVIVLRWTKNGSLALARPCLHCMGLLILEGLKPRQILYSTAGGKIISVRDET